MQTTAKNNKLDIAEIARRVNPILRKYDIARASVFGSIARGDANPDSDLDLLIEFEPGKTKGLFALAGLQIELEEEMGQKVDLVFYDTIKPRLRESILRDQIPVL